MKTCAQLTLDLATEPDYRLEAFCVNSTNVSAQRALDWWPRWRDGHLLILGPKGCGKTHLGKIWQRRSNAKTLSSATIGQSLASVSRGMSLLVEDIDKNCDEQGLFHLINLASGDAGISLLITATRSHNLSSFALADLSSRLKAAETTLLHEPDDDLLKQVIDKLFKDKRTPLSPGIVDYMACRMDRSIDYARRLVAWLDREALSRKSRVTRTLVRQGIDVFSRPWVNGK